MMREMDISSVALVNKEAVQNAQRAAAVQIAENKVIEEKIINLTQRQQRTILKPINVTVLEKMIEAVNRALSTENIKVQLKVHKPTNIIVIKIIDTETNKVIREIPPEKILEMIEKLQEIVGLIVDESR